MWQPSTCGSRNRWFRYPCVCIPKCRPTRRVEFEWEFGPSDQRRPTRRRGFVWKFGITRVPEFPSTCNQAQIANLNGPKSEGGGKSGAHNGVAQSKQAQWWFAPAPPRRPNSHLKFIVFCNGQKQILTQHAQIADVKKHKRGQIGEEHIVFFLIYFFCKNCMGPHRK